MEMRDGGEHMPVCRFRGHVVVQGSLREGRPKQDPNNGTREEVLAGRNA